MEPKPLLKSKSFYGVPPKLHYSLRKPLKERKDLTFSHMSTVQPSAGNSWLCLPNLQLDNTDTGESMAKVATFRPTHYLCGNIDISLLRIKEKPSVEGGNCHNSLVNLEGLERLYLPSTLAGPERNQWPRNHRASQFLEVEPWMKKKKE